MAPRCWVARCLRDPIEIRAVGDGTSRAFCIDHAPTPLWLTATPETAAAALAEGARLRALLREARTHVLDHLDCVRGTPLADNVDATLCGISVALAQGEGQ